MKMKVVPVKYLKNKVCNFATAGALVFIFGITMAFYGFPKIIKGQILKRVALEEGAQGYKMWKDMPFPLTFKVYIFNVTNPEEIAKGSKPKVEEIGPYIYDQYREKQNIVMEGNDTISYELKKTFFFNETRSAPLSESDVVTVLNVALLGMAKTVNTILPSMLGTFNQLIPDLFGDPSNPFIKVSIADLLFNGVFINCSSPQVGLVCNGMKSMLPPTIRLADEPEEGFYFSMFQYLNDTFDGPYTIRRGMNSPGLLGSIVSYKNKSKLEEWNGDCQDLKGSDSTLFSPIDEANYPKKIYIFQPEVCRPMFAEFKMKKTVFNLQAYRYETTRSVLGSYKLNPKNQCFCPSNWSIHMDSCALDGVQNLEPCQKSPVIASFPHFYLGDSSLRDYVADGILPNKTKHGTFVDIEPKTGVALDGAKRLQFNMELVNLKAISILSAVEPGLFPIVWIEESAEINEHIRKLLTGVHDKIKIVKVVQWIIVAFGIILMLAACHFRRKGNRERWSANRVDFDVPTYGASVANNEVNRPTAAQNDGRFHCFKNQAFGSNSESIAHK